jgi:hypothetical protein
MSTGTESSNHDLYGLWADEKPEPVVVEEPVYAQDGYTFDGLHPVMSGYAGLPVRTGKSLFPIIAFGDSLSLGVGGSPLDMTLQELREQFIQGHSLKMDIMFDSGRLSVYDEFSVKVGTGSTRKDHALEKSKKTKKNQGPKKGRW